MRVLVVEDEELLAHAIAEGLRREGLAVDIALDGRAALDRVFLTHYDVVVLDRDLPAVHGDDVCRRIHEETDRGTRILMLTASGSIDARVEGLRIGADDYLPKPFAFAELIARVHALSRRATPARPAVLRFADLEVDLIARIARRGGIDLQLSRKELAVLGVLLQAQGAPVSTEELLERAWDENADPFTNTVRQTIVGLRRKLGEPPIVRTMTGVGYQLRCD